jgi:lysophospholipase L1-like esterase
MPLQPATALPSPEPLKDVQAGQEPPAPSAVAPAPEPPPTPAPPVPVPAVHVTAIGDSVMVGAADQLVQTIGDIDIDAEVGRAAWEVVNIVRQRDPATLGQIVVIHIGNNGQFLASEFDQIMQSLGGTRLVVFVNLKVPRSWEAADNQMLATNVARYPNARLVDWHAASINQPQFFCSDGFHLRPEGAQAYAQLIADSLSAP